MIARRPACFPPLAVLAFAASMLATGPARAAGPIAFGQPGLQAAASLSVSAPGVADGGLLPTNFTADGRDVSPPLSWSAGPPATASYAVIMEDADSTTDPVRWVLYNLPRGVTSLPRGLHNLAEPTRPIGAAQGRNDHGGFGYAGPRPAPGDLPHHYHIQVFALDRPVRAPAGAELARVERAMWGHVVARGELVATYPAPPGAAKASKGSAAAVLAPPADTPPN